jgi:hypothetical protein
MKFISLSLDKSIHYISNNFTMDIFNLSNNSAISECPSLAISDNNIYVMWEDYTSGNDEIYLVNILYDYSLAVRTFFKYFILMFIFDCFNTSHFRLL